MFSLNATDSCKPYFKKYETLTLPYSNIVEVALCIKCNLRLFVLASEVNCRIQRDKNRLYIIYKSNTSLMHKRVLAMAPKYIINYQET